MTKFLGLYCCESECDSEADFYIVGNLNNGMDNDTHACWQHVGGLLGTPAFLTEANTEWSVSEIPLTEKERWRALAEVS